MFVSMPEFRFPVPAALAPPGAAYWRTLTTSVNTVWYILKAWVEVDDETELRTMLLWWDQDVVEVIDQMRPIRIESLVCVLPRVADDNAQGDGPAPCVFVREVWEAVEDEAPTTRSIVFIDQHGQARSGLLADEVVGSFDKVRLIARVGERRGGTGTSAEG